MDGSGLVQWLAIVLSFVAIVVILRYARQPRCEVCARRHARLDAAGPEAEAGLVTVDVAEPNRAAINWKAE